MGYMRHHAIIVTSFDEKHIERVHKQAQAIFSPGGVSPALGFGINGYWTFFIPPDGSREGWGESDSGNERRRLFRGWLNAQAYEDGSSPFDWAEVQYGDEEGDNCILYSEADTVKEGVHEE